MSMNALISLSEIHVAMDYVEIPMDHMNASVHLDMSLIQVGNFAWVSSCYYYTVYPEILAGFKFGGLASTGIYIKISRF